MDINDAIATLQTLSANIGAQLGALSLQQQAVDTAVKQLQGTLDADLSELEDLKEQVADSPVLQDKMPDTLDAPSSASTTPS